MSERKSAKRIIVLLIAGFLVFALTSCGTGKNNDTSDGSGEGIDENYGGVVEEADYPDDSYGGSGGDGSDTDSSQRKPAVAAEGQYKTVFHRTNESEGIDTWCYLVWDGDGSNVRMIFFGKEDEGEISFTEMDGGNYYGNAVGTVKINGKVYDSTAEFSMQSQYEEFANMQIKTSGDETDYLGLDGVVSIEPVPVRLKGFFFGDLLDPMMILSGDDYRLTAQLSNYTDSCTVENIFYCCPCRDEEKKYNLRNLDSFTSHGEEIGKFSIDTFETDIKTNIWLTWQQYDGNGEIVGETSDFPTSYYYFYDHKAPANYENHDGDGQWGRIPVNVPAGSFEPMTDDYIIMHETVDLSKYSRYGGEAEDLKNHDVEFYDLYSFDEKGKCVQDITLTVFQNDDDARFWFSDTIMDSDLDVTVDGRPCVVENNMGRRGSLYYTKEGCLARCLEGGLSSWSARTWYEDVHYYEYTVGNSRSPIQVYVSKPPRARTLEEHMAIIDRRGSYEISDTQSLNIGFDIVRYFIFLYDNTVTDDVCLNLTTNDINFTADGFDACFHDVNFQVFVHGEYVSEGIKATISIKPRDPSEMNDFYIKPKATTVEKIYPFTTRKFRFF